LILALVKAYNSGKIITECLTSLRNNVDRIVVADGYYPDANQVKNTPGNGSTDDTEQIVKAHGAEWIPAPAEQYSSEAAKMNRMLQEVQEGDWVFWFDTDERLVGDVHDAVRDLGHSSEILPVLIKHPVMGELIYARLFHYKKGMRMVNHWTVKHGEAPSVSLYLGPLAKRFWINHL
jgi:glycosyltransferase involved in cell wall biosynthesis